MADTKSKGRPMLSQEGLARLEEELNHLKLVKRKEIAEQIKLAKEYGDLSENAEYDEAKNEQARIEGQIAQMEEMLRTAVVVNEEELHQDTIGVGTKVKVLNVQTGVETVYQLVGANEADPLSGKISNESPVGAALIGKRTGDEVTFAVPNGMRTLKVIEFSMSHNEGM